MTTVYDVHEGYPSWHQQRAGHISAGVTAGFETREAAESFVDRCKGHRPNAHIFIVERQTVGAANYWRETPQRAFDVYKTPLGFYWIDLPARKQPRGPFVSRDAAVKNAELNRAFLRHSVK